MSSPSPGPSIEDDSSRRRPRRPSSVSKQGERGRASAGADSDEITRDGDGEKVKIQRSSKRSRSAHMASAARRQALELERTAREAAAEDELEESLEGTRDAPVFLGSESDVSDPKGPLSIDLEPLQLNLESSIVDAVTVSDVVEAPLSIDIDKIKPREGLERGKRGGKRRPTTDDLIDEAVRQSQSELETFKDEDEDSDDLLGTSKITEDSGPAGLLPAGRPDPLNTGISGRRATGRLASGRSASRRGSGRRRGSSRRRATGTGRALTLPKDRGEPRSKRDIFLYLAIIALVALTFLLITAL